MNPFPFPKDWGYRHVWPYLVFIWALEISTQILLLLQQAFLPTEPFLQTHVSPLVGILHLVLCSAWNCSYRDLFVLDSNSNSSSMTWKNYCHSGAFEVLLCVVSFVPLTSLSGMMKQKSYFNLFLCSSENFYCKLAHPLLAWSHSQISFISGKDFKSETYCLRNLTCRKMPWLMSWK